MLFIQRAYLDDFWQTCKVFEKREKEEDRECGISVNGALMTFPEEDEER